MFRHIPVDDFNTQINGNVDDALHVLDARLRHLKCRPKSFDWEFTNLDPENPVTQVSKTPSDEEFPCEWGSEIVGDEGETLEATPAETPRTPPSSKLLNLQEVSETSENENLKESSLKIADTEKETLDNKDGETTNVEKKIRPEKPTSIVRSRLIVNDVLKFIEEMKKKISQEDQEIRVIPSYSSCRFELPIDMTKLEDLTPLMYIIKFCRVSDQRRIIYGTEFEKYCNDKDTNLLFLPDIRVIYENLFREETLCEEILHLRRLLDLDLSKGLDKELFIVISCLMERIIIKSKGWTLEEGFKRNDFEATDFCSLNGKLHGIDVTLSLRHLLEFIRNE